MCNYCSKRAVVALVSRTKIVPLVANDILLELNGPMETASDVWFYGAANAAQHLFQINVNLIDEIVD